VVFKSICIFSGHAHPALAEQIASYLEVPLGRAKISTFSDGGPPRGAPSIDAVCARGAIQREADVTIDRCHDSSVHLCRRWIERTP